MIQRGNTARRRRAERLLGWYVAAVLAFLALPILVLLMETMAILRQPLGQRILRSASLDDIAIWGVLALIYGRLSFTSLPAPAYRSWNSRMLAPLMRQQPCEAGFPRSFSSCLRR